MSETSYKTVIDEQIRLEVRGPHEIGPRRTSNRRIPRIDRDRIIGFRRRVLQGQNIAKENVHAFMRESADGSIIARRIPSEVEIRSEHDHGSCGRGCAPPKRRGAIQADKRKGRGATLLNPMKQSAKCIFVSALITIWWWQVTTPGDNTRDERRRALPDPASKWQVVLLRRSRNAEISCAHVLRFQPCDRDFRSVPDSAEISLRRRRH